MMGRHAAVLATSTPLVAGQPQLAAMTAEG